MAIWSFQLTRDSHARGRGQSAENMALDYLQAQGLVLVDRNYRTPGRGGGEIDLVMRDEEGTLVFVEVRSRRRDAHGSAAATVNAAKQKRIILAARHYLAREACLPPCRFDVLAIDGDRIEWIQAAFNAH